MKCRKCSAKAVINMRHHKLALCKEHYLEWIPEQTQRFIEKYRMFSRNERILAAVSGGKDSLSLWDILWRQGYQVDGLYIGLGIDDGLGYSEASRQATQVFAGARGLNLLVVDIPEIYGASIPEMASRTLRGADKPCSVCGLVKRHVMNRIALEGEYDVLVTGHNLDDEASVLFCNTMNWRPGHLSRQSPVLEADRPGFVRKAKPLCRLYEREMAAYALLSEIDYVYEECPYVEGSTTLYYKEILNKMEGDHPGAKLNFYLGFLQAKQKGLFVEHADPNLEFIHACTRCGQPTSAPGECAFCRMVSKAAG